MVIVLGVEPCFIDSANVYAAAESFAVDFIDPARTPARSERSLGTGEKFPGPCSPVGTINRSHTRSRCPKRCIAARANENTAGTMNQNHPTQDRATNGPAPQHRSLLQNRARRTAMTKGGECWSGFGPLVYGLDSAMRCGSPPRRPMSCRNRFSRCPNAATVRRRAEPGRSFFAVVVDDAKNTNCVTGTVGREASRRRRDFRDATRFEKKRVQAAAQENSATGEDPIPPATSTRFAERSSPLLELLRNVRSSLGLGKCSAGRRIDGCDGGRRRRGK